MLFILIHVYLPTLILIACIVKMRYTACLLLLLFVYAFPLFMLIHASLCVPCMQKTTICFCSVLVWVETLNAKGLKYAVTKMQMVMRTGPPQPRNS